MRSQPPIHWLICGSIALLFLALSSIWVPPATAQTQDSKTPDLQELNKKLDQLEKELEEVKSQIRVAAAEKPSNPPAKPQDTAQSQKTSEQADQKVAIPSEAIIAQPQAGTVPVEGEITERKDSVDFYGFVMLDSG
ncbi:MAG TPA: hypothetical protein VEZ90_14035, partial [Blastocatellia bacterium]|nr:hypothetical protein [Blastocatellia bacterium]